MNEDESRQGISDHCSRGSNASRASTSEIAGQRLYQNAIDTQKKLEEKTRERNKSHVPKLNLATRGRHSRESRSVSGDHPRYMQLYGHAKSKQEATAELKHRSDSIVKQSPTPTRNARAESLYSLSAKKQQEGKERRMEIMKAKSKPPLSDKKIAAAEAAKLYTRGMKHILSLEMKRMEAAFEMNGEYVSPFVPRSGNTASSE